MEAAMTASPAEATVEQPAPAPTATALCTADVAECTCPDFCERDHDNE
jgi:hypothetical protein